MGGAADLSCERCLEQFSSVGALRLHMFTEHPDGAADQNQHVVASDASAQVVDGPSAQLPRGGRGTPVLAIVAATVAVCAAIATAAMFTFNGDSGQLAATSQSAVTSTTGPTTSTETTAAPVVTATDHLENVDTDAVDSAIESTLRMAGHLGDLGSSPPDQVAALGLIAADTETIRVRLSATPPAGVPAHLVAEVEDGLAAFGAGIAAWRDCYDRVLSDLEARAASGGNLDGYQGLESCQGAVDESLERSKALGLAVALLRPYSSLTDAEIGAMLG